MSRFRLVLAKKGRNAEVESFFVASLAPRAMADRELIVVGQKVTGWSLFSQNGQRGCMPLKRQRQNQVQLRISVIQRQQGECSSFSIQSLSHQTKPILTDPTGKNVQ
jgi:hypothetical protein